MSPSVHEPPDGPARQPDALLVLLPLLIVLSTFLLLLLLFLVCVLLIRRRRAIVLRDRDGPVDMSREELIEGDGAFRVLEQRWIDSVAEPIARAYNRANGPSSSTSPPPLLISPQNSSSNTPQILFQRISHSLNSFQFRRKASPPGLSIPTTRQSTPSLFMLAQRSPFFQIPLPLRVYSLTFPCQSSTKSTTGKSRCSICPRPRQYLSVWLRNLILPSVCPGTVASLSPTIPLAINRTTTPLPPPLLALSSRRGTFLAPCRNYSGAVKSQH